MVVAKLRGAFMMVAFNVARTHAAAIKEAARSHEEEEEEVVVVVVVEEEEKEEEEEEEEKESIVLSPMPTDPTRSTWCMRSLYSSAPHRISPFCQHSRL
jgi:hypothetical protein